MDLSISASLVQISFLADGKENSISFKKFSALLLLPMEGHSLCQIFLS